MRLRIILLLFAAAVLLPACSPMGPVKFYAGPPKAPADIARVKVPGPITVLSIDGRKVDAPSKEDGFYELHLPPGKHLITFKYVLYWGTDDLGNLVKSDVLAVDTTFVAGRVYELTYTKPENDDEALSTFSSSFSATLVDRSSGEKTGSYKIDNLNAAMLARNMQQESAAPATAGTPTTSPAGTPAQSRPMPSAEQAEKADPLKRLKFWWLMANEKERREFREWSQAGAPSFSQ